MPNIIRVVKQSGSEVFVAANLNTVVVGRCRIVWWESTNVSEELDVPP